MRIRGIGRLRQTARRLRGSFVPTALILVYHRVAEIPSDPQLLCVAPDHFGEHMEILRRKYRPVRLQPLAGARQNGDRARRSVAVTFDDGYADNLYAGKPLLERFDVPATVFVTSGYIGEQHEFWWDELDRLLLQPGTLPDILHLSINGSVHRWELSQEAHYGEETYWRYRAWSVLEEGDLGVRQRLYRSLCGLLRPLPGKERREVLGQLRSWADIDPAGRQTHRTLTPAEVMHLGAGDLIEVGAHTVSHPVLSILSPSAQRAEIEGSKRHLEDIVGHPVAAFAYPYGSRSDYTAETVTIVKDAGFACACSNFSDVVWRGSDRFQLPRVLVRDWDGDEFASQLERWFRG